MHAHACTCCPLGGYAWRSACAMCRARPVHGHHPRQCAIGVQRRSCKGGMLLVFGLGGCVRWQALRMSHEATLLACRPARPSSCCGGVLLCDAPPTCLCCLGVVLSLRATRKLCDDLFVNKLSPTKDQGSRRAAIRAQGLRRSGCGCCLASRGAAAAAAGLHPVVACACRDASA